MPRSKSQLSYLLRALNQEDPEFVSIALSAAYRISDHPLSRNRRLADALAVAYTYYKTRYDPDIAAKTTYIYALVNSQLRSAHSWLRPRQVVGGKAALESLATVAKHLKAAELSISDPAHVLASYLRVPIYVIKRLKVCAPCAPVHSEALDPRPGPLEMLAAADYWETVSSSLPERARLILQARQDREGLRQIGKRIGITGERVRQIQAKYADTVSASLDAADVARGGLSPRQSLEHTVLILTDASKVDPESLTWLTQKTLITVLSMGAGRRLLRYCHPVALAGVSKGKRQYPLARSGLTFSVGAVEGIPKSRQLARLTPRTRGRIALATQVDTDLFFTLPDNVQAGINQWRRGCPMLVRRLERHYGTDYKAEDLRRADKAHDKDLERRFRPVSRDYPGPHSVN